MDFRGAAGRICGVDLDPRVLGNPFLDEARVADVASIPYEAESFDVVVADNLMEHLERPELVLHDVHRVLRPGGVLLFKTPNRAHYVPMLARMTPHPFHAFVNKLRGRRDCDTFPTFYRANSAGRVRELAARTGFAISRLDRVEGRPEYLRMTAATYLAGAAYERLVNSAEVFAPFRVLLIAELRKRTGA